MNLQSFLYQFGWVLVLFAVIVGYLIYDYKTKGKDNAISKAKVIILDLITLAERTIPDGEAKFLFVLDNVYKLIPNSLKLFITEDELKTFIQDVYNEAKNILATKVERKYSLKRQEPDDRDFIHPICQAITSTTILPSTVDLRTSPKMPPIFDQKQLGSCTSNGGICVFMFIKNIKTMMSRLYLYWFERYIENPKNVSQDTGANIRDIGKALLVYGVCEEKYFPYVNENKTFSNAPTQDAKNNALRYRVKGYHALNTLIDIKNYLVTYKSPIMFGLDVYSSFESSSVAKTGMVPMPNLKKEQLLGGHCVDIVGFKDTVGIKNSFKKLIGITTPSGYLICRNSWGLWGDKGYFYLPYEFITQKLAYDFWVLEV